MLLHRYVRQFHLMRFNRLAENPHLAVGGEGIFVRVKRRKF